MTVQLTHPRAHRHAVGAAVTLIVTLVAVVSGCSGSDAETAAPTGSGELTVTAPVEVRSDVLAGDLIETLEVGRRVTVKCLGTDLAGDAAVYLSDVGGFAALEVPGEAGEPVPAFSQEPARILADVPGCDL